MYASPEGDVLALRSSWNDTILNVYFDVRATCRRQPTDDLEPVIRPPDAETTVHQDSNVIQKDSFMSSAMGTMNVGSTLRGGWLPMLSRFRIDSEDFRKTEGLELRWLPVEHAIRLAKEGQSNDETLTSRSSTFPSAVSSGIQSDLWDPSSQRWHAIRKVFKDDYMDNPEQLPTCEVGLLSLTGPNDPQMLRGDGLQPRLKYANLPIKNLSPETATFFSDDAGILAVMGGRRGFSDGGTDEVMLFYF